MVNHGPLGIEILYGCSGEMMTFSTLPKLNTMLLPDYILDVAMGFLHLCVA